jgi:arabinose-5-phosphate isomerase
LNSSLSFVHPHALAGLPGKYDNVNVIKGYRKAFERAESRLSAEEVGLFAQAFLEATRNGHAYISGIGKSRYVAERLAAILRTLRISASFLHPADALHGEVGTVRSIDAVLFVSASGESKELIELADHSNVKACPTFLLTLESNSSLSQRVTRSLMAPVEGDVSELFPAASSAMLACIGDWLCVEIASQTGLRPEEAAKNHPAGTFFSERLRLVPTSSEASNVS